MLKIELIRFEAQDVITTSVSTPEPPVNDTTTEDPKCACHDTCTYSPISKNHWWGAVGNRNEQCFGLEGTGVHTCENK